MPTLVDAVLARSAVVEGDEMKGLKDSIIDREEFVCPVPSEFPVVLGVIVEGEPNEVINISTEVRSHMNQSLWFDSGRLQLRDNGRGQFPIPIPIPVRDVGPCYITLQFNKLEVWKQRIFFARA
jgi:hypothetical protein